MQLTDDERRRRRNKNWAVAGLLIGLVVLFYLVTIVRIGGNIAS